jgi:endoglucanase
MVRTKAKTTPSQPGHLHLWSLGVLLALLLAACGTTEPTQPPPTSVKTPSPTTNAPTTATTTPAFSPTPTLALFTPTPTPLDSKILKGQVQVLLNQLWQTYKDRYVQQDGRVRDPQRTDASTSEGESYALLRAYWQSDRTTFDAVLNWSLSNLQLPRGDKLFAYLWGKAPDDSWKVLDRSAATDADQDITFALLLAARKWNESRYQTLALEIINDIWDKTVVTINGKPYLTAGDWSPALARPVLNPSYFSPYEYRLFAQVDPNKSHNWTALIDSSYEIIKNCTTNKLDATTGKLPPNWCAIDKQTGALTTALETDKAYDTNYGYDAFRTVWRLALDYRWYGEKRALSYLQSLDILQTEWKTKQKLTAVYDHAGQPKDTSEDLGIYAVNGVTLFSVIDPTLADQVVAWKLLPSLQNIGRDDPDPAHEDATKARTYYAQNWTWFGLAFYADQLGKGQ